MKMSDKYIEITEDLKEVLLKHKDALNLTEDMCNEYPDSLIHYIFFMNNLEDLNSIPSTKDIFDNSQKILP